MKGIRQEATEPLKPWLLRHGDYHKGAGAEDKTWGAAQKKKAPRFPAGPEREELLLA
jgi:hypothetical protein